MYIYDFRDKKIDLKIYKIYKIYNRYKNNNIYTTVIYINNGCL